MASIQTGIQLSDNFTAPLMHIINSVNMAVTQMEALNNSMNSNIDTTTLEGVRNELNQATISANQLNEAIDDIDSSAPARSQENFNETIRQGTNNANDLVSTIKGAVAAYATMETVKGVLNASDELIQTQSRLDMIRSKSESLEEIQNKIYASAERSRASYIDTADAVANLANNAGNAFQSNDEIIAFLEAVNKQFVIGNADASTMSGAMTQLTQAMAAGALRGDELNSVLEGAPGIARAIESSMGWAEGSIKSYAEQGLVTSEVVKNAMLSSIDDINAKFDSMPMTWGQVWTSFQNSALMAFEPVLNKINELANNDEFQNSLNSVMNGLSSFASFTLDAFNMVIQSIGFVADNWNTLMPIIVGVTSAVIAYKAAHTGMQIISSIVSATAAAYGIEASQVTAATVAQYGLNAALNACPFVAILSVLAGVGAGIAYVNNEFGSLKITLMVFEQIFKTIWENFLYFLTIVEVKVAEFVASFISRFYEIGQSIPVSLAWAKAMALTEIQDMVNGAIDLINDLINTVNKIPGVSLETIQHVTFGTDAQIEASVAEAAANANIAEFEQQQQANVDAVRQWSDSYGAEIAKNQADREAAIDKAMTEQANAEKNQNTFDYNKYLNFKQKDFSNRQAANIANSTAQTAANTADAANNTAKVADAVAVTAEDLKYLRDMAEAETINRFTTASITVNQTNHNTVNNDMDLDGVTEHLRSTMEEQMAAAAEGVH